MAATVHNSTNFSEGRVRATTPSTLLIPKKLLNYFKSRAKFFGSRKFYFQHLIVTYGRHLLQFEKQPFSKKWKNKYQEPGLDLQPKHFKPDPGFWEEFRHLSSAYGLAMCHLFVILLKLEHERWIKAGKPENFFEKISRQPSIRRSGMNSSHSKRKSRKNSLEKLLNSQKCTILVRIIDFSAMKLERMAIIRQD